MEMNSENHWGWYIDIDIDSENITEKTNKIYKERLINHNKIMRDYEELSYLDEFADKEEQDVCFSKKSKSSAIITAVLTYVIFFIL